MTSSTHRKRGAIGAVAVLLIALGFMVLLGVFLLASYNGVQSKDEAVDAAWANVEAQLQRRYDLIPNLVNTVKGYAEHESELLTEVTRLRSQWGAARSTGEQAQVASQLEGALGRLMVVVERYPQLQANQNFLALQSQLEGTENRIAVERTRYNDALRTYNSTVRRIPGQFFGDPRDEYFEAATGAETAPAVQF